MAARSVYEAQTSILHLDSREALRLFEERGGEVPEACSRAAIYIVDVKTLGADFPIGAWLLVAPPPCTVGPGTGDDDRSKLAGDLCIIEVDRFGPTGRYEILVRLVWSEPGDLLRIVHPTTDWAPGDRGQAPGVAWRREQVRSVLPVHGVLAFYWYGKTVGPLKRVKVYTPASRWLSVAGRIMRASA